MWQWSCDGMIEGLGNGMMLIMWTNNKRAGTRGTILPPLHLPVWSHCVQLTALHWLAVYPTVAVNSNVLIGHSGSLQSLDRDRLWWEATKAPTEYKIGQLVREPQKRRFLRKIPLLKNWTSIAHHIFWRRSFRRAGPMSKRSFMQSDMLPNTIRQRTGFPKTSLVLVSH